MDRRRFAVRFKVRILLPVAAQPWDLDFADAHTHTRSLSNYWVNSPNPPSQKFYKYKTPLSQISLFMLLDLLGSSSPSVPSYFATTHWAYRALSTVESRMRSLNLLESSSSMHFLPDVNKTMAYSGISDDHLPFIWRGVETLHVIPQPFPRVWHTEDDDGAHLDMKVVRDWARVVAGFILEWLDMMEVWTGDEQKPGGEDPTLGAKV